MKVIIVGGGPAGMFAAIASASDPKNEVILIEKNEKLGKKLYISGKGRCNVTNACKKEDFFKNVIVNPKFLYSSFEKFSNQNLIEFIENNGCPLKVERGDRVFPVSDKSSDIIGTLSRALKKLNVKIFFNSTVKSIEKEDDIFHVVYSKKNEQKQCSINSDCVIVATGGISYKATGSTGDGYNFAKKFDMNVTNLSPSLVPYNVKEINDCIKMQGLGLKNIGIKIFDIDDTNKVLYKDFGELLFTHFGVSGPVILSASSYLKDRPYILSIDLKSALNEKQLNDRLIREFSNNTGKNLKKILESLLPKSMIDIFIDRIGENKKASELTKNDRMQIINLLKDFRLTLLSKRGYDEAIVTEGGVDTKEIDPKTMESKKVKGLFFAGEVLNVNALTGGFNIQIAVTTGYVAGLSTCRIPNNL